jgi:hypothetical protein
MANKKRTKIYMKEHPGYPGIFVTVDGKVISTVKGELKQYDNHGYLAVNIPGHAGFRGVHRLIAETFIPNMNPELFTQVDHINNIKNDNRVENLRWVTPSENTQKAYSSSTCNRNRRPVSVIQIDPNTNEVVNTFSSLSEACRVTGAYITCIRHCLAGFHKTAAGYKWCRASLV